MLRICIHPLHEILCSSHRGSISRLTFYEKVESIEMKTLISCSTDSFHITQDYGYIGIFKIGHDDTEFHPDWDVVWVWIAFMALLNFQIENFIVINCNEPIFLSFLSQIDVIDNVRSNTRRITCNCWVKNTDKTFVMTSMLFQ